MRIYVGNLPFSMTDIELRAQFEEHGTVDSANVITDRESGRSRGFGFVEMRDEAEARRAIQALAVSSSMGLPLSMRLSDSRRETPRNCSLSSRVKGMLSSSASRFQAW